MNVLRYIRVSGKGQIDGEGPDRQREFVDGFCSRHGLHPVGEYFDAGVTGTIDTLERPQFLGMIRDILKRRAAADELDAQCKAGSDALRVDAVVVESADRLARTLAVQESAVVQLRKHGIKLFLAKQGTLVDYASDSGDPSLNMFRQMLGVIAEFEKVNMCQRLSQARLAVWKRTGRCEGVKPYGQLPGENLIRDTIFQLRKESFGPEAISSRLNANGYKTRKGLEWTSQHVRDIFRSGKRRIRSLAELKNI